MGNPTDNALPRCQIARVSRLVSDLERAVTGTTGELGPSTYRIWIDPLLCPIELEGKKISLELIPKVYKHATHVLVIDASLVHYESARLSSTETLLRMFACSSWMRRLWTLQGSVKCYPAETAPVR